MNNPKEVTNKVIRQALREPIYDPHRFIAALYAHGFVCVDIFMQDGYLMNKDTLKQRLGNTCLFYTVYGAGMKNIWYTFQQGQFKVSFYITAGKHLVYWSGMGCKGKAWEVFLDWWLDCMSEQTNRSLGQTKFLLELCNGHMGEMMLLEWKIKNCFVPYCPGDRQEVEKILYRVPRSNYWNYDAGFGFTAFSFPGKNVS